MAEAAGDGLELALLHCAISRHGEATAAAHAAIERRESLARHLKLTCRRFSGQERKRGGATLGAAHAVNEVYLRDEQLSLPVAADLPPEHALRCEPAPDAHEDAGADAEARKVSRLAYGVWCMA